MNSRSPGMTIGAPVGRVGVPEDIAQACEYLTERAGFVTGQNIIVDGGMRVKMIYA
jgi:NAD(P)-dependent dehydrogenase (short-subunit alcohol dehydrogenase family)